MKTFTDVAGRTWTIALNLGTALAVKENLGVDLLQPEMPYTGDLPSEASAKEGPPLLTRLGTDELLLGEVLCALLEEQFEAHKVTAEDVRAGFDGATLLAAQKAFYEELVDFFRSRGRSDRARAVQTQERKRPLWPTRAGPSAPDHIHIYGAGFVIHDNGTPVVTS